MNKNEKKRKEMDIEVTSQWIGKMFDHIPVQYYFAEIEESKHTNRKYRTEQEELAVDLQEIVKRDLSVEGKMTVSEYNAIRLIQKQSAADDSIKQFMEEDDIGDFTRNPTDELRERLHAKIEEVRKGKGVNQMTKQKITELPESKKHPKKKEQKEGKEKKEQYEKTSEKKGEKSNGMKQSKKGKKEVIEPFVRPSMTSPELKDNLEFGTITFSNTGKTVPKYLTKKQKK